ncbi:Exfoliative toxin B precursor [Rubripirellula lacrimiformis]|uniref:Serine protease n=1 Tax=Rubripirellula lacrimiformis TaxID=1930273 RepID=A0A517N7L2_9BACT|nr:DNA/RNA non-specific endonuclease [Rubripirellula lacrimiformis]QDT03100.1 Exfoliative toxin B precursor [Rubripirellula lacrimiformis]
MPQDFEHSVIPDDVIRATEKRFRSMQRKFDSPLKKSQRELLAQNEPSVIQNRLERAGVDPRLAKRASQAGAANRSLDRESMSRATISDTAAFERILNGNDLVDVRFLLKGASRIASVGRINFSGRGFATGFLVGPGVVMTNHHVFGSAAETRGVQIEFGFHELDRDGNLSTPTKFNFDASQLFFADEDLDVAIVAIGSRESGNINLGELPIMRLVPDTGVVITGERLNVVQHPAGEPKQVALRDNTVIAIPDETFLHYRADTKRGSSGSPVFNDEWQLVGLHHSGVPDKDDDGNWLDIFGNVATNATPDHQIAWIANEAIQSSALVELLDDTTFRGSAQRLVDGVLEESDLDDESIVKFDSPGSVSGPKLDDGDLPQRPAANGLVHVAQGGGTVRVTVPVEITFRIGESVDGDLTSHDSDADSVSRLLERFGIDRDYSNRNGFDTDFLGQTLYLPGLSDDQIASAAVNRDPIDGDLPYVLRFHNYSVVMNGLRRLAYFTAVNIDGEKLIRIRSRDDGGKAPWSEDRRIGAHEQTNNDHYRGRDNKLDRGHLVRRLDPGWGAALRDSARGIVDTYHYVNCAPQYDAFNQADDRGNVANGLWLGLENFALDNAEKHDLKISVFTGPVFRDSDPDFRDNGVRIPTQYWKVIAWVDEGDDLQSAAFLLSQKQMLDDDPRIERMGEEAFDFRERDLFQTTIAKIEELTDLDFGPLSDTRDGREAFRKFGAHPLRSLEEIILG